MKSIEKKAHATRAGEVFDWINRILTILTFLGISVSTVKNFLNRTWEKNWIPVAVWGAFFIIYSILFSLLRRYSSYFIKTAVNVFSRKSRYKLLTWENTYEYLNCDEMQFRSELTVKPLETGVEYIRTRYNWSGGTEVKPEPITDDGFMTGKIENDGKEFGYHFYRVFSKTMLNGNDPPVKLGIKICNLKKKKKTASPHLLTNINVETDVLILKVILPNVISFQNVEYLEYLHATDDFHWHRYVADTKNSPVTIESSTNSNKTTITWEIKKPVFGGKYVIRWEPIATAI